MKTKRKKELNKEDFQKKKNAKGLMTAVQKEQCKVKRNQNKDYTGNEKRNFK